MDEDKQTTDGKKEGRAFRGDDAEEQWWPFHVSLQRHPCATELAVVTTPATSIAFATAGGIGTRRHRCRAISYHSALSYSCQVSLT